MNKIGVRPNLSLFYGQWCFVKQGELIKESILFRFNVGESAGPFKAKAELLETFTGFSYVWSNDVFEVKPTFRLMLNFQHPQDYTIRLSLDDQLAYSGRYQEEQLPF